MDSGKADRWSTHCLVWNDLEQAELFHMGSKLSVNNNNNNKLQLCCHPVAVVIEERREINLETHLTFLDHMKSLTVKTEKLFKILQNKYSQIVFKKYNRKVLCKQNKITDNYTGQ